MEYLHIYTFIYNITIISKNYKLHLCVELSNSKKCSKTLFLKLPRTLISLIHFGSKFQSRAAATLNIVCPSEVFTLGISIKV
jgi:hypothetical protein